MMDLNAFCQGPTNFLISKLSRSLLSGLFRMLFVSVLASAQALGIESFESTNRADRASKISSGTTYLNLEQAISEGAVNSPKIEVARSASEEARWKKRESLSGFLPNVTLVGTDITSQNYMVSNFTMPTLGTMTIANVVPSWNYTLSAQLPIFDGFASTNNYRAASSGEEAVANDYSWTQFKVEKEITLQFFKALGSQILKDVAEQNLKTIEDHLRDVLLFKKAGVSTNYDVLRVEVQVSEAKSEVMNAQDNSEIAKQKLAEILGEEREIRALNGDLPVLKADRIRATNLDSFRQRSDLLSLEKKKESLEFSETAASRFWSPKISLFGNYSYYNNINTNFPDSAAFRDAYQVGVTLTWNLFDGMLSISRSKESVERRYQAEKSLRMARLAAMNDFEMWKRKYLYYCNVYQSRVGDVDKSSESVRLAREGHRVGARTNTDILDAESELFRARAGVINAQIGAIEALINLELATGQRLLK